LAPRSCESHRCIDWLRALLAALLTVAPSMSARTAAEAPATPPQSVRAVIATRFSKLEEVTPANVRGLMPLVARSFPVAPQDEQSDRTAPVDLRLQRFVDMHSVRFGPPRLNDAVSYVVSSGALDAEPGAPAATLAQRELRALDPIERRVIWRVREALPISSRTLVTAGGLVFYGTSDGWFKALDASTGRIMWKHRVDGKRLDDPISYRGPDGHQYIAVRALPQSPGIGNEALLVFSLAH
jgi:glucose dehydrogenase